MNEWTSIVVMPGANVASVKSSSTYPIRAFRVNWLGTRPASLRSCPENVALMLVSIRCPRACEGRPATMASRSLVVRAAYTS